MARSLRPLPALLIDPYHRLHEARATAGWLVDITHLVAPDPPAPWKDATPELLAERFACLRRVGAGAEWAAEPEEIVDYTLMRRATSIEPLPGAEPGLFRVAVRATPHQSSTGLSAWRSATQGMPPLRRCGSTENLWQ